MTRPLKENEFEGTIISHTGGIKFTVELDVGQVVSGHLGGKLQSRNIRLTVGDRVYVKLSEYDLEKGIITWRN